MEATRRSRGAILLAAVGLVLALPPLLRPARAQRNDTARPAVPALTVVGNAEVRVPPDEATVRLGVSRQAPTAQEAQNQASEAARAILNAITALGVRDEQIQTSQLTLFPIYAEQRPGEMREPRIVAYRAANIVTVRLDRLSLVGPVVDAALKAGANQLEGVAFGLRDDLPARERALREAVREARAKARAIAEALEVRLGPVLEVREGETLVRPPVPLVAAMEARVAQAPTPVPPGQVIVGASVTLRYRIEER